MANTQLFASNRGTMLPASNTHNEVGGSAYQRDPRAALALFAATGCLNGTFYANADAQLDTVLTLSAKVDPAFVAKTAIYARRVAFMKDMPVALLASLSLRSPEWFERVFPLVIDNGKQLRTIVQMLRSGRFGRKSLGSMPKRLVRDWVDRASTEALVRAAIGQQPSLADVIRMVHPKPGDAEREALYAWVIGRGYREDALPMLVQAYEAFKRDSSGELPDLPFQYYTSLSLTRQHWCALAAKASWQSLRMNLNTFARHGVFENKAMVAQIAKRLRDPAEIARARVYPYQLMMAAQATNDLPAPIAEALNAAMEVATRQVPVLQGRTVVAVDVSGSMASPVTGFRGGGTSKVRCVDVAALIAACLLRTNRKATVLPFDWTVSEITLDAAADVLTQAARLASLCGGGTSISAPLAHLNREHAEVDLLVLVSDNESWGDTRSGATETMRQWAAIKQRCPQARMVCIDLQPYATSQTVERDDILHVGGFSDAVFDVIAGFATGGSASQHWIERIDTIDH